MNQMVKRGLKTAFVFLLVMAWNTSSGCGGGDTSPNETIAGANSTVATVQTHNAAVMAAVMNTMAVAMAQTDPTAALAGVSSEMASSCATGDAAACLSVFEVVIRNLKRMLNVSQSSSQAVRLFNPNAIEYSEKLAVEIAKLVSL